MRSTDRHSADHDLTRFIVGSIGRAAIRTGDVTATIGGVSQAARETSHAATPVLAASSAFAGQTERLGGHAQGFLEAVQAA